MKKLTFIILLFSVLVHFSYSQSTCASAQPFCTGTTYNFPASTNVTSQPGPNYGCLFSQPNPAWYYLQISTPGNIDIKIAGTNDVDFIAWGPFSSLTNICSSLGTNSVDCSYSASATETLNIVGATVGQFYMVCITNYANVNQNISFSQIGGGGATNCAILCNITGMTKTPSACNPATNTYSVTGSITVFAPPTSGNLTITNSCGGSVVLTPPFTSPIAYSMTGLTPTGGNCNLTASFSADPTCTFVTSYTSPAPCNCSQTLTPNSPTICQGATANLTVGGATNYTWNPGGLVGSSVNVSPAVTTIYTVTGATGTCVTTKTTQVTVNPTPTLSPTSNSPLCSGSTLNLNAGTTASTYTWTGPNSFSSNAQNPTIANVTAAASGNYNISLTSAAGCTNTAVVNVTVTTTPTLTVNSPTICPGAAANLTVTGATNYTWNPGGLTGASVNVSPGSTTVYTVTGANGTCTTTQTTQVTVNPTPTINPTSNSPCVGNTLNLNVGPATSFTWTGPNSFSSNAQNPSIPGVTAAASGNYNVTITSAVGCTNTAVINVTINPLPVIATNNPLLCVNSTFTITSSGGSTYAWSGPGGFTSGVQNPVIPNATTAMSGAYTVTVTTAAGCTNTAVSNVTVVAAPTPTAGSNSPVCEGGSLQLNGSGGSTYSWSGPNGFTSAFQNPSITNVTAAASGVYTLLVSAGSCTATTTTSVTINPLPVVTATNNSPVCETQAVTMTAGGASTYTWSGPGSFASNLANPTIASSSPTNSGVYTVIGTSAAGCTNTAATTITVNPTPNAVAGSNSPVCLNNSINLNSSGGTSYSWSGPNGFTSAIQNPTIPSATAINNGVYTVTVTALGCVSTATTSVTVSTPTTNASNTGPYCAGATIQLNAVGATSYTWTGPGGFTSNSQNPTIGSATTAMDGVYNLLVSIGTCTAASSTSVTVNALPTPTANNNSPICDGQTLNLTGSAAISYTWSGPGSFSSNGQSPSIAPASPVNSGVYTFSVTDANGCINGTTTTVTVNPLPVVVVNNTIVCINSTINLTANGGTSYSWSGPNSFSSSLQNPSIPSAAVVNGGMYTVTVTALGCSSTGNASVTVTTPTTNASNTGPYCAGATIQLNATTATSFTWTGPGGFTSNAQNPTIGSSTTAMDGVYNLLVTIGTCTAASSTSVTVNPLPTPVANNSSPVCDGQMLTFTGSAASSYTWTGPGTITSPNSATFTIAVASPTDAGVYTFSVTDANGCINGTTTTVTVNTLPVVVVNNPTVCLNQTINLTANGGTGYSWNGPLSYTSASQNPSIANSALNMSGLYTVTVTDANGCVNTGVSTVSVYPLPVANASNNGPICVNGTLILSGSGGAGYSWTGPNGFSASIQNPTISPVSLLSGGIYSLVVTAGSCSSTDTTLVTINTLPNPVIGPISPVCINQPLNLTSSGGMTSYAWTGPGAFSSSVQNPGIPVSSLSNSGIYSLTVVDGNNCSNSTTYSVTVNNLPVVAVTGATVCENQTINLSANGGVQFAWTGPGAYTSSSQNPSIANSTSAMAGQYSVTVTDFNNCSNSGSADVIINAIPSPVFVTNSNPICVNQIITIGATGGTQYTWSGPNGFFSSTQNNTLTASMAANGNYFVTVTGSNGCSASASLNYTVNNNPVLSITSTSNKGCSPLCVTFTCQSNVPLQTSSWAMGNGSFSNGGSTAYSCYTSAGIFTVSTSAVDLNGCPGATTYTVESYPQPVADFNYSPLKPVEVTEEVVFTDASHGTPISSWTWYFTNSPANTSNLQNPSFYYPQAGTYAAVLVVKSDKGCLDTLIKAVDVGEDYGIYVPNAFTPNGDGLNDIFQPKGHGIEKYEMMIFDRWGEKIFATNNFDDGWDGKKQAKGDVNYAVCPQDIYTWIIKVTNVFGKAHEYTGHVTLMK